MQQILDKWGIKVDYNLLLTMWNESHRHYHNQNHLLNLVEQINENKSQLEEKQYEKLILCSLFHDIIYDPSRNDNEERSAEFFINSCIDKNNPDLLEVKQMILDTKTHEGNTELSELFNYFDMKVVEGSLNELIEWERGISAEYEPVYGKENYKSGRIKFLESLVDRYPTNSDNIIKLIKFVENN
jgi:pantetheine-phosphate adenylyltransferase